LKKHCGAEVALLESSGGVFEVTIDGDLVYSKKETGVFPDEMQLLKGLSDR